MHSVGCSMKLWRCVKFDPRRTRAYLTKKDAAWRNGGGATRDRATDRQTRLDLILRTWRFVSRHSLHESFNRSTLRLLLVWSKISRWYTADFLRRRKRTLRAARIRFEPSRDLAGHDSPYRIRGDIRGSYRCNKSVNESGNTSANTNARALITATGTERVPLRSLLRDLVTSHHIRHPRAALSAGGIQALVDQIGARSMQHIVSIFNESDDTTRALLLIP